MVLNVLFRSYFLVNETLKSSIGASGVITDIGGGLGVPPKDCTPNFAQTMFCIDELPYFTMYSGNDCGLEPVAKKRVSQLIADLDVQGRLWYYIAHSKLGGYLR
jgi:hypothetical protein